MYDKKAAAEASKKYDEKCLADALLNDPSGKHCNVCGCINTFADDCGWFYNQVEGKGYVPVCKNCNTMPPGDR